MAEHAETVEFWKGVVIGTLFGLVAAAYARGDFRRLFTMAPCAEPQLATIPPMDSKAAFRDHSAELKLRREASENAGDPTRLSPAVLGPAALADDLTQQAISIERTGGAPGPASVPEILEVPGRPGQLIDHSDAAQRVRSAARTHQLGSNRHLG
jgi:hypothetical protein